MTTIKNHHEGTPIGRSTMIVQMVLCVIAFAIITVVMPLWPAGA
jgi:hypothetical protein